MKVAVFSTYKFDTPYLKIANQAHNHELTFIEMPLTKDNIEMAKGHEVVSCMTNDDLGEESLKTLKEYGIKLIALRASGYDHVDLKVAKALNICVCRVPAYSPNAIAEYAVGLMLALNRKIHLAYRDVQMHNFAIQDKIGFDIHDKTVGIIGLGKIGEIVAKIMLGFGSRVLAYDVHPQKAISAMGIKYCELDELLRESDIISIHCLLCDSTYHLISKREVGLMKPGNMIINTARGSILDTAAIIEGLKQKIIKGLAIDVYEKEKDMFFHDLSDQNILDNDFLFLNAQPNVLITSHQAFLTEEALINRANTTIEYITAFANGKSDICYVNV